MSLAARMYGTDLFGRPLEPAATGPVAERFGFAPFSVLDARAGEWQDRKRAWIGIGIKSEIGRGSNELGLSAQREEYRNGSGDYAKTYNSGSPGSPGSLGRELRGRRPHSGSLDERAGREPGTPYEGGDAWLASENGSGTSIFDPVVCELAYRWFSAPGAQIVDPFAGGSVRGVVASLLGRRYWGCDLRQEQIDANREQAAKLCPTNPPVYVCGDSMDTLESAPEADLIFSCPPYGNLEVYSDNPADLSTMEWHTFVAAYKRIIMRACKRLKPNRFACFVVGDFRDDRGFYRDFVSTTIAAFREQGCELYNEAVLVTAVGSAAIRVTKQFEAGRKMCKTHQNVLVFCKGDWRKAAKEAARV